MLMLPVGVESGLHVITGAVGAWLVKVIVAAILAALVPPCPSEAVALALTVPGVLRL